MIFIIFIYTLVTKRPDSRTKLCACGTKTVQRCTLHNTKQTET